MKQFSFQNTGKELRGYLQNSFLSALLRIATSNHMAFWLHVRIYEPIG
jgi:hypothetical protein